MQGKNNSLGICVAGTDARVSFGETLSVPHHLFPRDREWRPEPRETGSRGTGAQKAWKCERHPPIPCPLRGHRFVGELSVNDVETLRWDRAPVPSRVRNPRLVAPVSLRISSGLPNRQTVTGRPAVAGMCAIPDGSEARRRRRRTQDMRVPSPTPAASLSDVAGRQRQRSQPPSPLPAPSSWVV